MLLRNLSILFIFVTLSACSIPAPKYSPSYENVQLIKDGNSKIDVEPFAGATTGLGAISLRGNSLSSPYGKDLIHYIEVALKSELEKANLLKEGSPKKIFSVIELNDLDSTSFSIGKGIIRATFSIIDSGKTIYKNSAEAKIQWDSSFIGAIAIPNAAQSYPKLVTSLLRNLYSDKKFISALKAKELDDK